MATKAPPLKYPVFCLPFNAGVVLPGNKRRFIADWIDLLPPGKTALEYWSAFLHSCALTVWTVSAKSASTPGCLVLPSQAILYRDGVLANIINVFEVKEGIVAVDIQVIQRCMLLNIAESAQTSTSGVRKYNWSTDNILLVRPPENETVTTYALLEFSAFLASISIKGERATIPEKFRKVLSTLPENISRLCDTLQDTIVRLVVMPETDKKVERAAYNDMRRVMYYMATYTFLPFVDGETLQPLVAARDLETELAVFKSITEKILGIESEEQEEDLRAKFESVRKRMNPQARRETKNLLGHFENTPPQNSEYQVVKKWLDLSLSMPWGACTEENNDLTQASRVLNEEHYGLERVKEEIVEFLAVRKQNPNAKGRVLCFVGPPGVGKTSLGKSIARATGRKFTRRSLGSVHDEAEIRGHRKTYIGAFPGMFIEELRRLGVDNPVFMLDEVDKVKEDIRGNPDAALMEVLDPEQNNEFFDHYLNCPYDLSKVLFICTANNWNRISGPLRDRMIKIEIAGYFEHEKVEIAKRHLIRRQKEATGISGICDVNMSDETILALINEYTFEAGVRKLEERIGKIFSVLVRKHNTGEPLANRMSVMPDDLKTYLGDAPVITQHCYPTVPGEAFGLAVIQGGGYSQGEILPLQCSLVPKRQNKRDIFCTGSIEHVMQESAEAAFSFIKTLLEQHNQANVLQKLEKYSIHIHATQSAQPKDGPSAGITMETAILSALFQARIKQKLAMTGEIDLKGRVTRVGGIVEKIIAAECAQIEDVIIPASNINKINQLPEKIRQNIKIHPVNTAEEAFLIAFEGKLPYTAQ